MTDLVSVNNWCGVVMGLTEFVHFQNLKLFERQLAAATNQAQRRQILALLTEEGGRAQKSPNDRIKKEIIDAPASR